MENIDGIIKRLNGSLFFFAYKTTRHYDFSYGGVNYESKDYFGLFGM